MEDLSFELNAPKNLKCKQTGSRKKFPELSSKNKPCGQDKENKKPTKSIKLYDPNEDIKKFLNKKPSKTTLQTKSNNVEKSKKGNVGIGARSKPVAKSTVATGYVSSNESYKMSTTYEFSGNSKDESANLSDDSLVQIFKSKLPTSVKINRILTPRINNLKVSAGGSVPKQKTDGNNIKSKKLTFNEEKPPSLPVTDQIRQSIHFRNSTDFNTFATPLKTTNTKISTPTESDNHSETPVEKSVTNMKSPLPAQNENPLSQKALDRQFSKKNSASQKATRRKTRNIIKRKVLSPLSGEVEHNSSLFSTLSNKSSESKKSSLFSSLSPSPNRNNRSSLFSTISMESKESHNSSGSVYMSATDSMSSTSNSNGKNRTNKQVNKLEPETTNGKAQPYSLNESNLKSAPVSEKVKGFSNLKENEGETDIRELNTKRLRSQNHIEKSSLFSSISSNESISLVNGTEARYGSRNIHSRRQNKSSLISGIERLNLTEENQSSENLAVPTSRRSQNTKPDDSKILNASKLSQHSSLFSSIDSKPEDNKNDDEVISISSDSSFDIDADLAELNVKPTDKESIVYNSVRDNVSKLDAVPSKVSNKTDTHASLYSTMGNINLTCGVKIRKSKYFFNSSDKSISSISEPSCIESSIMPSRGNLFEKVNKTPEANDVEEDRIERSPSDNHATGIKENIRYSGEKDQIPTPVLDLIGSSNKEITNKNMSGQNEKDLKFRSKRSEQDARNHDDIFDKTKVFNGEKWVDKIVQEDNTSFQFKEPTNQPKASEQNKESQNQVDLSTWGTNSRGNMKIKVDRYSLSFNFNKLMGKPDTTSTETLDQLSSDVKHCTDLKKRKSFNRDLRKSIEIKRSIVLSSDSDADTDDEIRVVSKSRRKPRILESSDESSASGTEAVSSETEDIQVKPKEKKTNKHQLLSRLTNDFEDILTINKKETKKTKSEIPSTPKGAPLDKKSKGNPKQLTAVPNTPLRIDKVSKKNRLTFLSSLSAVIPDSYIPHPEAAVYKAKYKSKKEELARRLFHLYNREVFDDKLPPDMPLEWNARMRTTSGFCYNKRERIGPFQPDRRSSRIALSKKILDKPDRLRDTLIHEMCHAASWLIDGVRDGHGPNWQKWTIYAMQRFPELPRIKRCHDYKIDFKYIYRCSQCDYEFGRHSKSLNTERKVCGYCHGKFNLITNTSKGETVAADDAPKRPPTQFAMFVKDNYAKVKQENAGTKHGDVMKILSKKFAETKLKDV
ncbi:hypothetical protein M8J75_005109 [Diaphorina citri]|nr:hypothetical protein M8J75_005109 [Diaphorina citri]